MSNTISYISSKKIQSTKLEKSIFLAKFLCMANPIWVTQEYIDKRVKLGNESWLYRKVKAEWIIWRDKAEVGAIVYALPANFCGTFDEYELEDFDEVGTLYKEQGKWVVLKDLEVVEQINREHEYESMSSGKCSIGQFGHDFEAYRQHLLSSDKANDSMLTRGHGLK